MKIKENKTKAKNDFMRKGKIISDIKYFYLIKYINCSQLEKCAKSKI